MGKMKVLHVADAAAGGGAESVFRDTILALSDREHFEHYVACRFTGTEPFKVHYPIPRQSLGKVDKMLSQIYSIRNYKALLSALNDCSPDLVHLQNYGQLSPSVLSAIVTYKKINKSLKVIHTVHTFEYVCSHHAAYDYKLKKRCTDCASQKFKFKIFYRGCSRLGYLHAVGKGISSLLTSFFISKKAIDHWVAPSRFIQAFSSENALVGSRISFLKNPIKTVKATINTDKPYDDNVPFEFIYFGRFSEEKNLMCLLNGFNQLLNWDMNCKLTLIGKGTEEECLRNRSAELGIAESVEFIGFLSPGQLYKRLEMAHAAVMTSKCYENAPIAIVEAILNNLIPIVPNHGGMKETIESVNFGITFNSDDCFDLAVKMQNVKQYYNDYTLALGNAKATIQSKYQLESYTSDLESLYNALACQKTAQAALFLL